MVPKVEQDAVRANPPVCTWVRARHLFHHRVFSLELYFWDLVYFPQMPLTFCLLSSESDQEHMATTSRKLWAWMSVVVPFCPHTFLFSPKIIGLEMPAHGQGRCSQAAS